MRNEKNGELKRQSVIASPAGAKQSPTLWIASSACSLLAMTTLIISASFADVVVGSPAPDRPSGTAAPSGRPPLGQTAPDFSLPDTGGNARSLSEFKGKFTVLEWNNPDCPFVRKHYDTGNMQSLQKEFTEKGVVWLAIDSSAPKKQGHYSAQEHNKILAERGSAVTALLLDPDGNVGRLYGANTTPHMFVINPEGNLIYNGAIDSDARAEDPKGSNVENYVASALNQAMGGQSVATPVTQPYGCSVKYAS